MFNLHVTLIMENEQLFAGEPEIDVRARARATPTEDDALLSPRPSGESPLEDRVEDDRPRWRRPTVSGCKSR
jgi:hypothetical protein